MKKIILISILFFIYGCGYTTVYKSIGVQDFQFVIKEIQGDRVMNNLIKNQLNLYSNKESINKVEIEIDTKFEKTVLTKDSSGLATDYNLTVNSLLSLYFNEKSKVINLSETINIKNQTDNFEQNSYEKNVKRNFASSIRQKLISEVLSLQ